MNRAIEIILALSIVGGTMAFGGVQTITFSIMEVVVFTLMFAVLIGQTQKGEIRLPLPIWPILFVAFVAFQLMPVPVGVLGKLSPPRLADLGMIPGTTWAALTVYPRETWLGLVKFLAYIAAFVLAAHVSDLRRNRSMLVAVLILLGLVEAAYGIVQYLTGWQQIFTYVKKFDLEEATGTFINRNHYAGHLEMVIPFVLAAAFYAFNKWVRHRHAIHTTMEGEERSSAAQQLLFYMFLLTLLVVAMVFSRSRAGILVTVLTIAFLSALAHVKVRRKGWLLGMMGFFGVVAVYATWIGLGPVLARFEMMSDPGYVTIEGRFAIWKDTVRLIRDFPLFGSGLGTFEIVYRQYQTTQLEYVVDHAHNDYLEFAANTGFLGAALLFIPIFYLLVRMIFAFLEDRHSYRRSITLGCIGGTLAILLHSLADFNLQIPANALVFAVILGIGYRVAIIDRERDDSGQSPH
ncbi:MAG: O-antigen ligase family protein [Acidobacteria bacterium]|nr:O-antigen ligase family protein [Acidobacteriota bacterium]